MVFKNFEDTFPSSYPLSDVQMNSLFIEEKIEMFGSKNNKIKAHLESKHPLVS